MKSFKEKIIKESHGIERKSWIERITVAGSQLWC